MARDRPFTANLGLGAKSGRRKARNRQRGTADTGLAKTHTSQPPLAGPQPGQFQAKATAARRTKAKALHQPASKANPGLAASPAQPPRASLTGKPAGEELGAGSNRAASSPSHPHSTIKPAEYQDAIIIKGPSPSSHRPFPEEKAAQDLTILTSLSPAHAELAPAGAPTQQEHGPSVPRQQPPGPAQRESPHRPTRPGAADPPEEEDLGPSTGTAAPALVQDASWPGTQPSQQPKATSPSHTNLDDCRHSRPFPRATY
ncbi:unnamed protein product [Victoria cruziana]